MSLKKHPLNEPWTLWHFTTPNQFKPNNYSEYLREVSTFKCVEDFWKVYSHIFKPTMLKPNDAMMLFRKDIQPEWEDSANQGGGEWRVSFPPSYFSKSIDAYWENILMWSIGEIFTYSEEVTGIYLKIKQKSVGKDRTEYRISLWTRHSTENYEEILRTLGKELKACFGSRPDAIPRLDFRPHTDSSSDPSHKKIKLKIDQNPQRQQKRADARGGYQGRTGDRRQEPHGGAHFGGRGGYQRMDSRQGRGGQIPDRGRSSHRGGGAPRGEMRR